jgi:cell division protein FtsL
MDTGNIFKNDKGDWSVEKIVGAIVTAVCLWMGHSVQQMSVQTAELRVTMELTQTQTQLLMEHTEELVARLSTQVKDLETNVHRIQIEQGRRTNNVAKVDILESRVSRIENLIPMD